MRGTVRPQLRIPHGILVLGGLATFLLVVIAGRDARIAAERQYTPQADAVRDAVVQRLGSVEEVVTTLASFINSSMHVDGDQFRLLSEQLMARKGFLTATGFFPLVTEEERREFEATQRTTGFPTFAVTEWTAGGFRPAHRQAQYFPLLFHEPFEPLIASLIGFDALTDPGLALTIAEAVDNAAPALSAARPAGSPFSGEWLFHAVYAGKTVPAGRAERRASVHALVAVRFDLERLLAESVREAPLSASLRSTGGTALAATRAPRMAAPSIPVLGVLGKRSVVTIGTHALELRVERSLRWGDLDLKWVLMAILSGSLVTVLLHVAWRNMGLRARELQLRLSEQARYRAVVEDQTELIRRSKPDGTLTFVNEAYCRYFEKSRDQLEGRVFSPPVPVEAGAAEQATRLPAGPEHPLVSYEHRVLSPSGEVRWLQWTDRGIFDDVGRILEIQSVGRDVTDLRRAAEALQSAKEEAESSSRAKSDFLARMSHEVRTPMSGVLGMAELLLLTELDPVQRRYAETIVQSGSFLLNVLNDVLDLSKIEANKIEIRCVEFDLRLSAHRIFELFSEEARCKGLRFAGTVDPRITGPLRGDPIRIEQILGNLLSNAIKFTAEGEVRASIAVEEEDAESVLLRFEVADTGIGIGAEHQERVFEVFAQIEDYATRRHGGTGLGLAIARRLTEMMGGRIGLDSAPGHGAIFHFTVRLPKAGTAAERPARAETTVATAGAAPAAGDNAGLRVLLAEDQEVNRRLAVEILELLGCRADAAANGVEAVEATTRVGYDVIFMDCQMPTMDGYEATRRIRASGVRSRDGSRCVPIIALTGHAMAGEEEKCRAAGMDGYISKPYTIAQIRNA
ncbi:MAG TPA: ATP-binding protein, partial [Candidatus Methanoperedens sp.]|nr:ATP-binding protein [Candidatus Methanoperedens sp.]